ncbi:PPC domain-containing DNA-binding protein [Thermodesulfobacteriota bacterium]
MKSVCGSIGKIVVIRMFPGEDVIQGLKDAIIENEFDSGVVLSILGTLSEANLHYVLGGSDGVKHVSIKGHYELTSGDGNFYRNGEEIEVHLHVNLTSPNENLGGHLLLDSKVDATVQAVLAELKEVDIKELFRSR